MTARTSRIAAAAFALAVSGNASEWTAVELDPPGAPTESVQHLGRAAVRLQNAVVVLPGADFRNGEIEFDLAVTGERAYVGLGFRVVDEQNLESFYVRPHQSGRPDAGQYAPVDDGSAAWQLHPHGNAAIDLSRDRWMRVRLVVWEQVLWAHVDSDVPQLAVRTSREPMAGGLALRTGGAPVHYANLRYRELASAPDGPPPVVAVAPPNTVEAWTVSSAFAEEDVADVVVLPTDRADELSWSELGVGPDGVANLARLGGPAPGADTRWARLRLEAAEAMPLEIDFGFSDRVRVYHDGRRLFSADDSYRSRDPRFLGTIGLHDRLTLHLHPGTNELLFAVSETFGGWGLLAAVEVPAGVRIAP